MLSMSEKTLDPALAGSLKTIGFFLLAAIWLLVVLAACLAIEYPVILVARGRVRQTYAAIAAFCALLVLGLSVRDVRIQIRSVFSDTPWMYATELIFLVVVAVGLIVWLVASLWLGSKWKDRLHQPGINARSVGRVASAPPEKSGEP